MSSIWRGHPHRCSLTLRIHWLGTSALRIQTKVKPAFSALLLMFITILAINSATGNPEWSSLLRLVLNLNANVTDVNSGEAISAKFNIQTGIGQGAINDPSNRPSLR